MLDAQSYGQNTASHFQKSGRKRSLAAGGRPLPAGLSQRRPNLLVVGASGHVAQAFLLRLQTWREKFARVVLLDPSERVLKDPHLDHQRLECQFIRGRLCFPEDTGHFHQLLARHRIDIVLDLTDLDSMPFLAAADAAGVSYVNTALNDSQQGVADLVAKLHPARGERRNAPHIISSGMNPGVVNIWVWDSFQRYGAPLEIVHFEYDTSIPVDGWRPIITWSRQEFLTETVWEHTGRVIDGEIQMLNRNALSCRQDMRRIMEPVVRLRSYPRGFLVLHEENVKLGRKLGASSKYLYAIHPQTMDYLEGLWRERRCVDITDLEIGDNTSIPLSGADTIGLCLKHEDKHVYYLHSLANADVAGTNATCAQVAVGVEAALTTLLSERLMPRVHFASDLYDTVYRDVVFRSLRVGHFVFERRPASPLIEDADEARFFLTKTCGEPAGPTAVPQPEYSDSKEIFEEIRHNHYQTKLCQHE